MIFGVIAIIFSFIGFFKIGTKKYQQYMALSLLFTAFTICSFYTDIFRHSNDVAYLEDVIVSTREIILILALCSIVINSIPLIVDMLKKD